MLLDRRAKELAELSGFAEQARHQDVEQRPQLTEVIFHRRPGQTQAVTGLDPERDKGGLGLRVLDELRLVQDQRVVGLRGKHLFVPGQQRIGRQDEIVFGKAFEPRLAGRALQHEHP